MAALPHFMAIISHILAYYGHMTCCSGAVPVLEVGGGVPGRSRRVVQVGTYPGYYTLLPRVYLARPSPPAEHAPVTAAEHVGITPPGLWHSSELRMSRQVARVG